MTGGVDSWLLVLLGFTTAGIGAVGGLGGAILLVPTLILLGVTPLAAAPLGLIAVAAGSMAATASRADAGLINHRLAVALELPAAVGAAAGALLAGVAAERLLTVVLALVAICAGVAGAVRRGVRNRPDPSLGPGDVGEWPGVMAGAYELRPGSVVPYQAKRLIVGGIAIGVSGVVAGATGTSGGFLKTPVMSELMHVPTRIAGATAVFMVGVTSSAALLVYAVRGGVDLSASAAVVLGGVPGGLVGAAVQRRASPPLVRGLLSALLVVIGVLLLGAAVG